MKKKLLCLVLIFCLALPSLTSCLLLDSDLKLNQREPAGDTNITVEGGPVIENIQINTNSNTNLLAASRAVLSAVSVTCVYGTGINATASAGAGVIYKLDKNSGDAYVITNYHVVYNASAKEKDGISQNIMLHLYGMEYMAEGEVSYAIPATYVGGSMYYDLAVLKVEGSTVLMESSAMATTLADSDKVSILETAIAIGNPGNAGISATVGSISVESEEIQLKFDTKSGSTVVEIRVMRTDAAVNHGNSGGGLFNARGQLIGIVNAKEAQVDIDNMGYAIPSDLVIAVVENVIKNCDGDTVKNPLKPTIGIGIINENITVSYDELTGTVKKQMDIVVYEVSSGSIADGRFLAGDIIRSVTIGTKTYRPVDTSQISEYLFYAGIGDEVTFNLTRAGADVSVSLVLPADSFVPYK